MWGTAIAACHVGEALGKERERYIEKMKASMSPSEFKIWQKEQTEERRHRELCQAIRDSKPDSNNSRMGFLSGVVVASLLD